MGLMKGATLSPMAAPNSFFANRLRTLRRKAGLSQPALAEMTGLGVSTIRHFEYGLREPTFATLVKLTQALGVSLASFQPPPEGDNPKKRKGD